MRRAAHGTSGDHAETVRVNGVPTAAVWRCSGAAQVRCALNAVRLVTRVVAALLEEQAADAAARDLLWAGARTRRAAACTCAQRTLCTVDAGEAAPAAAGGAEAARPEPFAAQLVHALTGTRSA